MLNIIAQLLNVVNMQNILNSSMNSLTSVSSESAKFLRDPMGFSNEITPFEKLQVP